MNSRGPSKSGPNLLLLINSISGGGAELVVANLCKHINRKLFNVIVCHLHELGERGEDLERKGYEIVELPNEKIYQNKYLRFFRLKKILKRNKIDIVHSHCTKSLVDTSLARMLIPGIKHIHTFHYGNYPHLSPKARTLEKIFCRYPTRLVAVGNEQKNAIINTFGIHKGKIRTIWNGIEFQNENNMNSAKEKTAKEKLLIGSISTLIEQKGIFDLLDAMRILSNRYSNFEVVIVGDGPLKGALEKRRDELGLSQIVKFTGWIHDAPQKILPNFDILVQSSLWEAMSMVVMEAMAAGKAAVVTDVGENRHVIENMENGIIVPRKAPEIMALEIERLILDKSLREKLGANARMRAKAECGIEVMVGKYERLYKETLDEGR